MYSPSFCPNARCAYHQKAPKTPNWYQRRGSYHTKSAGTIIRFCCNRCKHGFSERTFSIDYFTKKLINYRQLIQLISSGMGLRQCARFLGLSVATVTNRIERFARQSIGLSEAVLGTHTLKEDVAADELESFSVSQYFPEYYHLLAGVDSQFLYFTTHMNFKRKGRMSKSQRERREHLYGQFCFERGRQRRSFDQVMEKLEGMCPDNRHISLYTDHKRAYISAINRNPTLSQMQHDRQLAHHRICSTAPRTVSNRLFAVNYLDREVRKDMAAQVRETVRFNRNVCGGLYRISWYGFYHNYEKPYRINDAAGTKRFHYQQAGVDEKLVKKRLQRMYTDRVFITREHIGGFARKLWFKQIPTPLKKGKEYLQQFVCN
jgi:transposase-like protein